MITNHRMFNQTNLKCSAQRRVLEKVINGPDPSYLIRTLARMASNTNSKAYSELPTKVLTVGNKKTVHLVHETNP